MQLRSAARSSAPSAAARRGAGCQRQRDLASDLPLILGGIALATLALLGFCTLIALALAFGIAQDWPPLAWMALALLALPLLALAGPLPARPPALAAPDGAGPPWLRPGPGATGAASPAQRAGSWSRPPPPARTLAPRPCAP